MGTGLVCGVVWIVMCGYCAGFGCGWVLFVLIWFGFDCVLGFLRCGVFGVLWFCDLGCVGFAWLLLGYLVYGGLCGFCLVVGLGIWLCAGFRIWV